MKVILLKDIEKLGYKHDIVDVAAGLANNFLIPKGVAEVASKPNQRKQAENLKQTLHKEQKQQKKALSLSKELASLIVPIRTKTNKEGKIFGSITSVEIAQALENKGFSILPKQIKGLLSIKAVGTYEVVIHLYKDTQATLKVAVEEEK